MMLTAEIAGARIPGGRMTIVATHPEDKTKSEGRRKQLEELLARIKNTNVPVVVAHTIIACPLTGPKNFLWERQRRR